jgi:hypothetical protein
MESHDVVVIAAAPGPRWHSARLERVVVVAVALGTLGADAVTKEWARHQASGALVWPDGWAQVPT